MRIFSRLVRSLAPPRRPERHTRTRLLLWLALCLALLCVAGTQAHAGTPRRAAGQGAGGAGQSALVPSQPARPAPATASCSFDDVGSCLAGSVFSWVGSQIQQTVQPITDKVLQNPVDIIYQTPAEDSYAFPPIVTINAMFVGVVDAALATLLLIGASNLMLGVHLSLSSASLSELIGRLVLVVGLVHFNLYFLGQFIELENALALQVDHVAGIAEIANILAGLLTNPGGTLLTFLLMLIISLFALWLLLQMIVRIALVAVCLATAPLGLACLLLPQTMRWGRLWLTTFASSVMVQLVQIVALSLGGVFLTQLAATSLVRFDKQLADAFLAIGILFLVLKIPLMMQQWALHPLTQLGKGGGGRKGGSSSEGSSSGGSRGGSSDGPGGSVGGSAGGGSAGNPQAAWGDAPDASVFQSMLI